MASKITRQHITVNSNPDEIYDVFLGSKNIHRSPAVKLK
jgi:hypothetical protein